MLQQHSHATKRHNYSQSRLLRAKMPHTRQTLLLDVQPMHNADLPVTQNNTVIPTVSKNTIESEYQISSRQTGLTARSPKLDLRIEFTGRAGKAI